MAFVNMTNGVAVVQVADSYLGYWSERGFSEVKPPKSTRRARSAPKGAKKAGEVDEP